MDKRKIVCPRVPHMVHGGDYNPDQWLNEPGIFEKDIELLRKAGINSVSVGIFAWAALEPYEGVYTFEWLDRVIDTLYENGIYTILATPSGARPAWLDIKYPEVMRTSSEGVPNTHGRRHNHCYTSPIYREKVWKIDRMLAERYKDHPGIMMWHLSNEYGGDCFCDNCRKAFRDFLRKRYDGDIEKLNHAWWTYFWSHKFTDFDQIDPPSRRGESAVHGLNIDWRRFVTHQTNEFMEMEYRAVKEVNPDIPVTANYMGDYRELNYYDMRGKLDLASWDNYPRWHNPNVPTYVEASNTAFTHSFYRAFYKKPFFMMESTPSMVNWQRINKLKRPGLHKLASLQAVALGSDSVQYFQIRKSRGASEKFHGAVIDHVGDDSTRVFREVAEVGKCLAKLDDVVGTVTEAGAAILYDVYNRTAIDDFQGFNMDKKDYLPTCQKAYRYFNTRGIDCDVISPDDDYTPYKVIVLPMLHMLNPGVADRLKKFVADGGTLVATYLTGYVDESDLVFLGGFPGDGLREVFGIWNEEIDSLFPGEKVEIDFTGKLCGNKEKTYAVDMAELLHAEGAEVLAEYGSEFYKGMPCITVNSYGKGKAYYIGARIEEKALFDFLDSARKEAGLVPVLDTVLPEGVSVSSRTDGENEFVFVMNFSEEEKTVELGKGYTDILTGRELPAAYTMGEYEIVIFKR